jgi:hypothetical protein
MGKLMKYELFRRSKLLVTILLVLVFMEVAAVFGLYMGNDWLILFFLMLFGMAFAAFVVPLIDAVANYYSDFKNTHGYMLFLTPSSGYQIVGSKALFALIEFIAAAALVAGFYVANFYLAKAFGYNDVALMISSALGQIPEIFGASTAGIITLGIITAILQYSNVMMLAITALTIAKTLLSQKSFNWLIALLLFFVLSMCTQAVNGLVVFTGVGFGGSILRQTVSSDVPAMNITRYLLTSMVLYIVWISAGYVSSSLLLNKRVDL